MASADQPLPFWVRRHPVTLRVTALAPDAPAVRLVRGTEIYVAPRLRAGAGSVAAAAANGTLLGSSGQQQQQQNGSAHANGVDAGRGEHAEDARDPLHRTALRVQQLSAMEQGPLAGAATPAGLPAAVLHIFVSPATLARSGLRDGDWVRMHCRTTQSLGNFGCVVASATVAPGHVALSRAQCSALGCSAHAHMQLQLLTQGQRVMLLEAAALEHLGDMGVGEQQRQTQQQQQGDEESGLASGDAAAQLAASAWLRPYAESVLRRLLPVLAYTPRSLLHAWGTPRPGGLLITGPQGSGKSALVAAVGAALQAHPECLTHVVVVNCRELQAEGTAQARALISPQASSGGAQGAGG